MPMQCLTELITERLNELPDRRPVTSPESPIHSTAKAAQWSAGIYRAYSYLSARIREPWQRAELDRQFEQTVEEGPDFLKVRREAEFVPVPVIAYNAAAAAEIMKQAREIERETYKSRAKGKHGGGIGRMAMQLLEWFCFAQWPRSPYGMFPSLAYIAEGARMSRETVTEAMKTLELFGFLKVTARRKRIQTPFGPKQVQDTNCYVLGLAKGLGALALSMFGKKSQAYNAQQGRPSESRKPSAKESSPYLLKVQGRNFTNAASGKVVFGTS